jgi:hypothetical protein
MSILHLLSLVSCVDGMSKPGLLNNKNKDRVTSG